MWRTAISMLIVASIAMTTLSSATGECGGSIVRHDATGDVELLWTQQHTEEPPMDARLVAVAQVGSEIVLDLGLLRAPQGEDRFYNYSVGFSAFPSLAPETEGHLVEITIGSSATYATATVRAWNWTETIDLGVVDVAWDDANATARFDVAALRATLGYPTMYVGTPYAETYGPYATTHLQVYPLGVPSKVDHHTDYEGPFEHLLTCA